MPGTASAFDESEGPPPRRGVSLTGSGSLLGEAAVTVETADAGARASPREPRSRGVSMMSVVKGIDSAATARSLRRSGAAVDASPAPGAARWAPSNASSRRSTRRVMVNPTETDHDRSTPLVVARTRRGRAGAGGWAGLEDSPGFEQVSEDLPDQVSLLAYLDLRSLLALGEQLGLSADPVYSTLAPDLRALDAAALAAIRSGEEIRTDLRIAIGQPEAAETGSSPLGAR